MNNTYTSAWIETEAELRELIKAPHPRIEMKILQRLEPQSIRLVAWARLVCFAVHGEGFAVVASVQDSPCQVLNEEEILVNSPDLLEQLPAQPGTYPVGGLFVVPGMGETLRLNGMLSVSVSGERKIQVRKVFMQCPKAFIRSKLWEPAHWQADEPSGYQDLSSSCLNEETKAFVEKAPFAFLGTENLSNEADSSPRGDPEGKFVRVLDESTLLLPDRTGNRLVDSLRNILSIPRATLAFLIPGVERVLVISGQAKLTDDKDLLADSAVRNKVPKVGVLLSVEYLAFRSLEQGFWCPEQLRDAKDLPDMSEILLDQIKPGKKWYKRPLAKLFTAFANYENKKNLY